MAIINTGLLSKGLRSEFFARFEAAPTYYQDLTTRIASNSDLETYRWLGSVPRMREWGTGRVAEGLRTESYSVENLKYEATLEVDRDEIADDKTGQIRVRVAELAARAATHKDYLLAQLLMNGATDGFNSYDGVSFFNASHVSGASGVQSNLLTLDVQDEDGPSAEEFKAALKLAIAALLACKDDRGEPMAMTASGLVCVVPTTMYLTALEAVNASILNNTSNVLQGVARVIAFPWFTELTRWYLLKTDGVIRPFIFQDREPVEFTALTEESDEGFRREKFLYGVRARYRVTYGYWQYAVQMSFNEAT
ncbi:MAG TPA: Mu-like prophage major head subunit gpT family protein [Phycisphaerae bacterium]|nr:Mu-like prophage major head subunit gpT family protein [Phycisphaerae bacterium]HNU43785.1 Mu-like prophage major head subunit gpT family protein [Phycisphaerae bacterium]